MLLAFSDPNLQGNVGLGFAISYFTLKGCIISVPLNDIQDYDLVVDMSSKGLVKVQVKTSICIEKGSFKVNLRSSAKKFDQNLCDYLFVVDGNGVQYLIPRNEITSSSSISLGRKFDKFIVG